MTDQVQGSESQDFNKAVESFTVFGERIGNIKGLGRVSAAEQINTDDPETIAEQGGNFSPDKGIGGDAVEQQDGFTLPLLVVGNPLAVDITK